MSESAATATFEFPEGGSAPTTVVPSARAAIEDIDQGLFVDETPTSYPTQFPDVWTLLIASPESRIIRPIEVWRSAPLDIILQAAVTPVLGQHGLLDDKLR